jgi:hypothetical protein
MNKKYILTILFSLGCFLIHGQQNKMIGEIIDEKPSQISIEELKNLYNIETLTKSPGDTLWYEDFGSGFSTNSWTTGSIFPWIYTTAAPGGQYSSTIPPIASTTSSNGFASMPADFYNTPTPAGGFIKMDSYLTSGPITLIPKGDIILRWQQSYRYCCNANVDHLEVQVSSDNVNWSTFDAKPGISPSISFSGTFQTNISIVAANKSVIYLRFYMNASHYHWMVDDIAVVEGTANQLEMVEGINSFGSIYREGFFTMVPEALTQPLSFGGVIKNSGGLTANNVKLDVNVTKNSSIMFHDSSAMVSSLAPLATDTFSLINAYNNTDGVGDYTINYLAKGISPSYNPALEMFSADYKVTDTIFGKDYNIANGAIGSGNYIDGDAAGSMIGTRFNVGKTTNLTSVSYFISSSSLNVGAQFKAKVYYFDTSQSTINGAMVLIAQNSNTYTIQASELGTWVTISIDSVLAPGMYVAVAEQTLTNTSAIDFTLGRSRATEDLQPNAKTFNLSHFIYLGGAAVPTWGWITGQPMIRMNFGDLLPVGINESKETSNNFRISPNPNNGQFKIEVNAEGAQFKISVVNVVGQVVYNDAILARNTLVQNVDLSHLEKGIYFVILENGGNKEVQKVIVK